MKLAFHWRVALVNGFLIGFAFVVFGFQRQTLIFVSVALVLFTYIVVHLRSELLGPLAELSDFVHRAARGEPVQWPIVRSQSEAGRLTGDVEDWSRQLESRLTEMSDARLRLESILGAMVDGVVVFDGDYRIVQANDALERLLEVPADPVGRTCLEVFRNERLDRSVRRAAKGEVPEAVEFETGSGRTVRARLSPIRDEASTAIPAVVTILHDVTDIREIDRVRRDFVANVSHEFKTPLTSIRGYAETLLSESENASVKEFADVIYRNARHLESLVNDLLDLARMESEPPTVSKRVDVRSVVDEYVLLRKEFAASGSTKIEVSCPSMELEADPARLSRALSNLIDNAIRYNRPGREVRISGRREGSNVVVAVSDSGFGIPDAELSRIFERFYRVDKSRVREGGNTGLGLAIARHAIESQGGTLMVDSKVGSGSTFTIRLPATRKGS